MTACEAASPPGEGSPLHIHPEQDELIYTIEGTLLVKLGDELVAAFAGSMVFIPPWENVGDTLGRFIFTITPAAPNFERFFQLYAELSPEKRGVEAFARLSRETQAMEVVGPPWGRQTRSELSSTGTKVAVAILRRRVGGRVPEMVTFVPRNVLGAKTEHD